MRWARIQNLRSFGIALRGVVGLLAVSPVLGHECHYFIWKDDRWILIRRDRLE